MMGVRLLGGLAVLVGAAGSAAASGGVAWLSWRDGKAARVARFDDGRKAAGLRGASVRPPVENGMRAVGWLGRPNTAYRVDLYEVDVTAKPNDPKRLTWVTGVYRRSPAKSGGVWWWDVPAGTLRRARVYQLHVTPLAPGRPRPARHQFNVSNQ